MNQGKDTSEWRKLLTQWLLKAELEVLDSFEKLWPKEAIRTKDYVFIPGTAESENRILLVAHADTVWGSSLGISPEWIGNIVVPQGKVGLGADDRFGCAMVWAACEKARLSGKRFEHSIIITTGEERGAIGAGAAADEIWEDLQQHAYAVEIDRRGDREIAVYDGTTSHAFLNYITEVFPREWTLHEGTLTDISEICPGAGIAGMNLSAGYVHEHTNYETGCLDTWLRTLRQLRDLLDSPPGRRFQVNRVPGGMWSKYYSQMWPSPNKYSGTDYNSHNEQQWETEKDDTITKLWKKDSPGFWELVDGHGHLVGRIDAEEYEHLSCLVDATGQIDIAYLADYELQDVNGDRIIPDALGEVS